MASKKTSKETGVSDTAQKLLRSYKQCPDCLARMPLNAKICPDCGLKVGPVQADGKAKKPVDWKGYLISAILFGILFYFVKWAFFE